jgi:hypothetical protein
MLPLAIVGLPMSYWVCNQQDTSTVSTFRCFSTRKKEKKIIKEPRVPDHSWTVNSSTLSSHRYVYAYILTLCRNEHKVTIQKKTIPSCDGTEALTIPSQIVGENKSFEVSETLPRGNPTLSLHSFSFLS